MYYFWGPFIGAILMTFLVQGVLSRYGFYEHLAYGGILVLGMLFLPGGLMSVLPKIGLLKKKG
jgi:ABC-type branched-subunit amino acid transport system permease subunit